MHAGYASAADAYTRGKPSMPESDRRREIASMRPSYFRHAYVKRLYDHGPSIPYEVSRFS